MIRWLQQDGSDLDLLIFPAQSDITLNPVVQTISIYFDPAGINWWNCDLFKHEFNDFFFE